MICTNDSGFILPGNILNDYYSETGRQYDGNRTDKIMMKIIKKHNYPNITICKAPSSFYKIEEYETGEELEFDDSWLLSRIEKILLNPSLLSVQKVEEMKILYRKRNEAQKLFEKYN